MEEKTINTYEVSDTPFTIIEIVEKKEFKITIRNNIISKKKFKTKETAEKYIKSKPWELILNTTALLTDTLIINHNKK